MLENVVFAKDGFVLSAGCIHGCIGENGEYHYLGKLDGGRIIYSDHVFITDSEKQMISAFVKEAEKSME